MWRTERTSIMREEIADENDEKGKTFEFSSNFFLICLLQFSIPFFALMQLPTMRKKILSVCSKFK